jgi:hypothetical protein
VGASVRARAALALSLALALVVTPSAVARVFTGRTTLVADGSSPELGFQSFVATSDPAGSTPPSWAAYKACDVAPESSNCISSALGEIKAARAREGVRPMKLPGDFGSLSVAQQLLVVTNLERVDRGLAPVAGLAADLNAAATAAAAADQDPRLNHFNGAQLASNWAGGTSSTLIADYLWMYDDGLGSGNLDCQQAGDSGCWGHRHNILHHFDNPVAMGVGYAGSTHYGPSITELFIGGDTATRRGQADALLSPTWTQLSDQGGSSVPAGPTVEPAKVTQAHDVSTASTRFQIRVRRRRIRRGQRAIVIGRLRARGRRVAGQLVMLVRHAPGSTKITVVRRKRTRTGGRVRFHVAPRKNMIYVIVFWGSKTLSPASSGSVEVHVKRRRSR